MAITRVQFQAANTAAATATSLTITLGTAATVGNTIVVALNSADNRLISTLFGASTQFYTSLFRNATPTLTSYLSLIPVVESSQTAIVYTFQTAGAIAAVAAEYSGTNILTDIPPVAAFSSSATTTNTTASITTTVSANEGLFVCMATRGTYASAQTGWATGITNSFTSVAQTSTNINTSQADRAVALLERFVTSTGTYSTAATQPSNSWSNLITSFREVQSSSQYSTTSGG